jgi:hypothetical protein
MNKLKVQNFGPITSGFAHDDGFMNFRKVTVFIGNQGTGKSSIAKLYSTMSWLEKALFQERLKPGYVLGYNRFVKEFCAYQNLKSYFKPNTLIEYKGQEYDFIFKNGKLDLVKHDTGAAYQVPKIMYVPAERNFLSAVEKPEKLKGLPASLATFREELERSQQELTGNLDLPVGNARFEYDKQNKIARVSGKGYRLRLSEASSGFQSFVPLFLVSRNLASSNEKERDNWRNQISGEQQERLREEILKIMLSKELSTEFKDNAYKALSNKFTTSCFLNIVEELEQNLFPSSQRTILFKLLEYVNMNAANSLVLTTHSPYIINYLTLAIKAKEVLGEIQNTTHFLALHDRLKQLVPENAAIANKNVIVYELDELGRIKKLPTHGGLPSDENDLNEALGETNARFSDLLEIELAADNG